MVPRVRAHDLVAGRSAAARSGAGRRHAAGHPRPGARRPRHHHRRRAAARELFQPLRHRARRHRPRQSRQDAEPHRRTSPSCRAWSGKIRRRHPVEVRDVRVPARQYRPQDQDDGAGAVHDGGSNAQDDFYHDEAALALDYAARRQRRDQGPVRGRRRHRADRRALDAVAAATRRAATGSRRSIARSTASPARPRCICASAMRGGEGQALRLFVSVRARALRGRAGLDRGGAAQARSCRPARSCPRRRSSSASSIFRNSPSRRRQWWRSASATALPFVPAERIVVAPDCGMKYLPREVAFGKMKAMVEGAGIVRE